MVPAAQAPSSEASRSQLVKPLKAARPRRVSAHGMRREVRPCSRPASRAWPKARGTSAEARYPRAETIAPKVRATPASRTRAAMRAPGVCGRSGGGVDGTVRTRGQRVGNHATGGSGRAAVARESRIGAVGSSAGSVWAAGAGAAGRAASGWVASSGWVAASSGASARTGAVSAACGAASSGVGTEVGVGRGVMQVLVSWSSKSRSRRQAACDRRIVGAAAWSRREGQRWRAAVLPGPGHRTWTDGPRCPWRPRGRRARAGQCREKMRMVTDGRVTRRASGTQHEGPSGQVGRQSTGRSLRRRPGPRTIPGRNGASAWRTPHRHPCASNAACRSHAGRESRRRTSWREVRRHSSTVSRRRPARWFGDPTYLTLVAHSIPCYSLEIRVILRFLRFAADRRSSPMCTNGSGAHGRESACAREN